MEDQSASRPKAAGPGRASTSCSECQRRKQKCDKQWPCKHCQDRRVPHLCQFKKRPNGPSNNQAESPPQVSITAPQTAQKRKISEVEPDPQQQPDERALMYVNRYFHLEKDFEGLGYIGPGRTQKLRELFGDALKFTTKGIDSEYVNGKGRTDPFPPRPYADVLIHNFLDNINFVYCICHPEALLQSYNDWWKTRRTQPDIELEGLLFRIMAISTQFLPEQICERLEAEMSEDISSMKQRWHDSAESIHNSIRPGKGGLKQVQQLMLTASYFKTEAMFVDSWHALSSAIRLAQELNMHRDSNGCDISDFERELRRQVWMSLFTWDRLMSFLFDRPPMIHRRCLLPEPRIELVLDPIHPELPSPLLNRIQEFRLTKIIDKYLDQSIADMTVRELVGPLRDIKGWLDNLPAVFRVKDPDTTWDSQHPRIRHSRLGLHTTAYSSLFHVLQPCLTNETFPEGSSINERERLRSACMDYAIRMTDVVDRLTRYATHSRYHMSFCLFETAAVVCAAIVKDKQRKLPKRPQVLRALGRARNILDRLGSTTAVAKSSAKILKELMVKLTVEQPETGDDITEGQSVALDMDKLAPSDVGMQDSALGSSIQTSPKSGNTELEAELEIQNPYKQSGYEFQPTVDYRLDTADGLGFNDCALSMPFMDLAALEQMWDWNVLSLDVPDLYATDWNADSNSHKPPPEVH